MERTYMEYGRETVLPHTRHYRKKIERESMQEKEMKKAQMQLHKTVWAMLVKGSMTPSEIAELMGIDCEEVLAIQKKLSSPATAA